MTKAALWTQTVEAVLDQRQEPVPPVLVPLAAKSRNDSPADQRGGRVLPTGPDRAVVDEVLDILRSAQEVVVFSSFLLSDAEIQREVLAAAKRGCRVYGLISVEAKLDHQVRADDEFDAKTVEAHKRMLDTFAGRVFLRSSRSFHAKCVLSDPRSDHPRGLLLTANLTTEALTRNEEFAILLSPDECCSVFEHIRHAIWEQSERELVDKGSILPVKPLGEVSLPPVHKSVLATMPDRCQIRDCTLRMIGTATQRILVASFGWDTEHPVINALCERAAAGLEVTVLARYRPGKMDALVKLRRAGAKVFCFSWLHAKAVVADDDAIVMSANLQRHGLDDSFELGVRLSRSDTPALVSVLESWSRCARWALECPPSLEGVLGEVVPLEPAASPRATGSTITIERRVEIELEDRVADSADRLDDARLSEEALRGEASTRGPIWAHEVLFRYTIQPPRLPRKAKLEKRQPSSDSEGVDNDTGPCVYRLPDGSRCVGIATPERGREGRSLADSLGIKRVLAENSQ